MKDPRFLTIQGLLKEGAIKKFTDIFLHIPHTTVAAAYGTNNNRMKKMAKDVSLWTLEEIYKLADLLGHNKKKLALMAVKEAEELLSQKLDSPKKEYLSSMDNKKVDKAIEWLIKQREVLSINKIEAQLSMPQGTLKKVLQGQRGLAEQWHNAVVKWVIDHKK